MPALLLILFAAPDLDAAIEAAREAFSVPGAAAVVVKDGEVVYLKGFGVKKRGGSGKVTPDTSFAIASCTKAFTATLLAMLADEGKLSWDDKVRKHLDWFRLTDELADREVTLRDLFCHRSGMPRHDMLWAGERPEQEAIIRLWCKGRPSTSFRSTWEYSNVPFSAGGLVAGNVAGGGWAEATRRRILMPLAMKATFCTPKEALARGEHATPHYREFGGAIRAVGWDSVEGARPAGSMNSTARDLAGWLKFHLGGGEIAGKRLIAAKALAETHAAQTVVKATGRMARFFPAKACKHTSYGLGWFVHDHRGHLCVSHGGTLTGFRAQCMLVPEKKVGVFVMANLRPSAFTECVAKTLLDHALDLPADDWLTWHQDADRQDEDEVREAREKRAKGRVPDTKPSLPLAKYAGQYDEPAYGTASVSLDGATLTVKWGKYTYRLDHHHHDTFTAAVVAPMEDVFKFDRSTLEAHFRLGPDGAPESLTLLGQGFRRAKKG